MVGRDGHAKKRFSRIVRKTGPEDVPNGNAYRKMNETWDISDWHQVGLSYEAFKKWQIELGRYANEKQCRNEYAKWYLRK